MVTIGEWIDSVGSTMAEYSRVKLAVKHALDKRIAGGAREEKAEKALTKLGVETWMADHRLDHSDRIKALKAEIRRLETEQRVVNAYRAACEESKIAEIELQAAFDAETEYDNRKPTGV